ncbi:dihydroneopterin aldolase [Liquorilactobacillus uvarum]|uniref:dihydroneopterin aldolase n=1 Tax=Liquorilactobacillus uvarum TaxID=303240 RepID=UPI00288C474F|nr:dihydroneopterin aldolase [Liquorilactobacillus uvarum]
MYKIRINNMRFHSHIGVYQEEKKLGQNIEISLEVKFNINEKMIKDQVENTINYADFYDIIAEIVKASRVDLIETLALMIIEEIKQKNREKIATVKVKLKKMSVPIDGVFDNVEIEMER